MKRNIVKIDESKCTGCGICVNACVEGALKLVNGKAKLITESYCDGLGVCLPECPEGAITIEEREADVFDEEAVKNRDDEKQSHVGSCPGTRARKILRERESSSFKEEHSESELMQWPCQIKLVPLKAPYFDGANLLIAADCTAYAYAGIHSKFMRNKVTLIGCPKLDDTDYSEKIAAILSQNDIRSITVLKMEVPCCSGIAYAVKDAIVKSSKMIPWRVVTVTVDGNIKEEF